MNTTISDEAVLKSLRHAQRKLSDKRDARIHLKSAEGFYKVSQRSNDEASRYRWLTWSMRHISLAQSASRLRADA